MRNNFSSPDRNGAIFTGPGQVGACRVTRVSGLTSLSLSFSPFSLWNGDPHVSRPVLKVIVLWPCSSWGSGAIFCLMRKRILQLSACDYDHGCVLTG